MSQIKILGFFFLIIISLISLLILVPHKLLFSSTLEFLSENISLSSSRFKPSDNGQLFVFLDESSLVRLYLDIVRDTVCGLTLRTQERAAEGSTSIKMVPLDITKRIIGQDWPSIGITMVGQKRLMNIEWALRLVITENTPGDFIECGVWRGGGSIFARAVLKALNIKDRHVWLVDSFQGLPRARTSNDDDGWSQMEYLRVLIYLFNKGESRLLFIQVSLEEVQTNFRSFYLLDDQVHFCKGYFVDSLPQCNISQIAVLRMDGDMYESTMDQLFNLYRKVSVGGVIIVDDYRIASCQQAIHDFRNWHNITEAIIDVPDDPTGVYWIKKTMVPIQMHRYWPLLNSTNYGGQN